MGHFRHMHRDDRMATLQHQIPSYNLFPASDAFLVYSLIGMPVDPYGAVLTPKEELVTITVLTLTRRLGASCLHIFSFGCL